MDVTNSSIIKENLMGKITTTLIVISILLNTACTSMSTIPEKQNIFNSRNTFVTCRAADTISTALILHAGGIELNPIMIDVLSHGWSVFASVEGLVAVGA